jgi:nicotinamide riboside kinase
MGLTRIVVVGAECTGKTTLVRALAAALGAPWVPEFAREYAERVARPLGPDDVEPIARGQLAMEEAHEASNPELLVLDTDLLSTAVYAGHHYGHVPGWIVDTARSRRPSLYLVSAPDVPWQPDPVRDRPDARPEVHRRFLAAVAASTVPWRLVGGPSAERLRAATEAIDALRSGGSAAHR